ncbi:MAG TPA: DUF4398 domain-containing protein [Gammaproteobacteria bacterium]|nr:DUF4398 domain-containing protein [Gammaproteobacteria bacterium]
MKTRALTPHAVPAAAMAAMLLLAACSGQPAKPDASLVRAKTAIDLATLAGATRYAPADLNHAQSQLQAANAAQVQGDEKRARYQAEEAEANAQLALARTQAGKAAEAALQVQQGNQALQDQMERSNEPPQR